VSPTELEASRMAGQFKMNASHAGLMNERLNHPVRRAMSLETVKLLDCSVEEFSGEFWRCKSKNTRKI
jgi:hypothetical protein